MFVSSFSRLRGIFSATSPLGSCMAHLLLTHTFPPFCKPNNGVISGDASYLFFCPTSSTSPFHPSPSAPFHGLPHSSKAITLKVFLAGTSFLLFCPNSSVHSSPFILLRWSSRLAWCFFWEKQSISSLHLLLHLPSSLHGFSFLAPFSILHFGPLE